MRIVYTNLMLAQTAITPEAIANAPQELCVTTISNLIWSLVTGVALQHGCWPILTSLELTQYILMYRAIPLLIVIVIFTALERKYK